MQETSALYKKIIQGEHWFETSVTIGESGRLTDERGDVITFGGDSILVDTGGPESGFREDRLFEVNTKAPFFKDSTPCVGSAVSGTANIKMIAPFNIPKKARICIYSRAVNNTDKSEWVQQGVYFIDTRKQVHDERGFDVLSLKAFDAMMLSEVTYPSDNQHNYPLFDKEIVQFIADNMKINADGSGVRVDPRTWEIMTAGYKFPLPVGYSMREVLCMIAAAYAGNFIISPTGDLRLVSMFDMPPETRHLITEDGYKITFGGLYILV
nr:MAG TPA: hypothetical protein [Caudoviricetes sp.]